MSSRGFESITGFQYTISFDARAIEIVSVESGSLTIEEKNLNLGRTSVGILTMSWDNSRSQTVAQGETLYKMRLQAMKGGKLSRLMSITGDLTNSEAYDKEGNLMEVVLDVRNTDTVVESGVFELYQNTPNPFNKETVISYRLPESGQVKLTLYDLTGKVIRVYELNGHKGLNQMKVQRSEISGSGVIYYQLDAAQNSATRRMLISN